MSSIVTIKSIKSISESTRTIAFDWDAEALPGQFVMVWAPGMEEIPLSLSSVKREKSITFKIIGKDTERLAQLHDGEKFQVRGPYGNGYAIDVNGKKKILVVGGGIGIAPLLTVMKCRSVDAVLAGRNKDEVEGYVPTAKNYCMKYWTATDDGSLGFHGNAVDLVKKLVREEQYDEIIACGPEIMLFFLHQFLNKAHIEHQMSLERYMKCGCGVCGSCMMDGVRVCKDGPVFTGAQIDGLKEFGHSKRDTDGSLVVFR
jgi:dihydroorotate dehydrogenase electron transfer subunit